MLNLILLILLIIVLIPVGYAIGAVLLALSVWTFLAVASVILAIIDAIGGLFKRK